MKIRWMVFVLLGNAVVLTQGAACGNGGDPGANDNGVHLSDKDLLALNQPADFSCAGEADPAQVFSADTVVTGVVEDFEEGNHVPGIVVSVYASREDLLAGDPFDESAPSDSSGAFSITVPGGVARVHWVSRNPAGQDAHFDTVEMEDPVGGLPPAAPPTTGHDRKIISAATVESVPLSLGIARTPGRGVLAGTLYDCERRKVEHAAVRVYSGPPTDPDRQLLSIYSKAGLNTFYFFAGMPSRLQEYTDPAGQFLVANLVPGGTVWVEMWGRLRADQLPLGHQDCTEGCLVAAQEVPVLGDSIVMTDLNPLYAGN